MLRLKGAMQVAFSMVNYNMVEMEVSVPKLDTLLEESTMRLILEQLDVEAESIQKPLIKNFTSKKKWGVGVVDLCNVERRAVRLRHVTDGGNDDAPPGSSIGRTTCK